jgi:hypothetical protein
MDSLENIKKYKAKIVLANMPNVIIEVSGEPLVFEDKSYIKLFVYRLPFISVGGKTCAFKNSWRVAEETTGMLIGSGRTKQGAINQAKIMLNRYSKEKILEQINKHKKR